MNESFDLMGKPWIKVFNSKSDQQEEVSLKKFFQNANQYLQLSGETRTQDFAVLRFLLSILTRVYAENQENVDIWQELYKKRQFDHKLFDYLDKYENKFDLFGDYPFYQVTKDIYNQNVEPKKRIEKGKGTVAIKQINRTVSESNNSPSIFSPKSENLKNSIDYSELARWIITYQNYTGVTDKTKILTKEKFSVSSGWAYGLNSFYAKGKDLFETLMLNLILDGKDEGKQKPYWEFDIQDYLDRRKKAIVPDNLSELYTLWSRMLHIEWKDSSPVIFTAGLPKISNENKFDLEPMTTWRIDKKGNYHPAVKGKNNLNVAMWRNFGDYVEIPDSTRKGQQEPRLMSWLRKLDTEEIFDIDNDLNLVAVSLVSDGNATSQSPFAEINDDIRVKIRVVFDRNPEVAERWPKKVEDMVELSQEIGKDFWIFANNISTLIGLNDKSFANKETARFYDDLNEPFVNWLESIKPDDRRPRKQKEWRNNLNTIANLEAKKLISNLPDSAFLGRVSDDNSKNRSNVFTVYGRFRYSVSKHLGLIQKRKLGDK